MDSFFDYIVDAAYKIEEFNNETDFSGILEVEGKFTSLFVKYDLQQSEIAEYREGSRRRPLPKGFPKDLFCTIFSLLLGERRRLWNIEAVGERNRLRQEFNAEYEKSLIRYAGSMAGE